MYSKCFECQYEMEAGSQVNCISQLMRIITCAWCLTLFVGENSWGESGSVCSESNYL